MLTAYQNMLQALIQAPNSPIPLIPVATQTTYINTARGQVAGEAQCIRYYGQLTLAPPTQQYPFSAITFPGGAPGAAGVLNVRLGNYIVPGSAGQYIRPRPWEWFHLYYLCNPVPKAGFPEVFAQFGQGNNGTLWFNLPDLPYVINLDTVCYPIPLVNDATVEAIPYLWTDAVPYYAAWIGMMQEQRQGDADKMMERYKDQMDRARKAATSTVLPGIYQGQVDPFMGNRLGIGPARAAQ